VSGGEASFGPGFDEGDLVECIAPDRQPWPPFRALGMPGQHFHVGLLYPPDKLCQSDGKDPKGWGFIAAGDCLFRLALPDGRVLVRDARLYRRVEPRPLEFWTGDVDVTLDADMPGVSA
jgi:hypothetical protein